MADAVHELVRGTLTMVIEKTLEPTTWLLITGWEATSAERKIGAR